jgi:hypothetical protein
MGEAKHREVVDELTKGLVDQGRLIEAGWLSFRIKAVAPNAPQIQLDEMRVAFFSGAHHLLGSMMSFLEAGDDVTEADLKRVDQVQEELEGFLKMFKLRLATATGSG